MSVCLFVCLSVCLSVCYTTPPREVNKGVHVIYGWTRNLSESVFIYILNPPDQPSGRYCPKTGQWYKEISKNRHFLEVFEIFMYVHSDIST